jgi:pimeloyl-ACP methyl ester carboxylesterase
VRTTRIVANGLTFECYEDGPPEGPLALCLHGFPDSAYTWRHLLPRLAEAGFHAVAPFMRGYAPTDVPADGAYDVGALAADVTALHEALGGDGEAVLIGHDWGAITAYTALAYAPQCWRRGVTLAVPPTAAMTTGFFDPAQLRRSFYIFVFQTPLAPVALAMNDLALVDALWHDWSPGYDASGDLPRVKAALAADANRTAAIGYYRAMLGSDPPHPAYADVAAASAVIPPQPVLYLHGVTDGALGVELVTDAAAHLSPESAVEVLEGVGHFLHLEAPDEVGRRVITWLSA